MKSTMPRTARFAAIVLAAALCSVSARADSAAEFYSGRTVTIIVPVSAGGVYGVFAQILNKHIVKHIPGQPTVILQYLTGAGGIKALNYVYNAAPRDGTVFVTPTTGLAITPVLRPEAVKYDPAKFNLLGGWGEAVNVLTVMDTAPVKTFEQALTTEVVLGSVGKGTTSYQIPAMLNELLGTKFKLVSGYRGGSPIRLAMEKGELHGWAGLWLGWKARKPEWVRDGKLVHLLQMASRRQKDLPDVPLLTEFARDDEQRAIFGFLSLTGLTGRTFAAPPGVPADRLAAMEKAYLDTLTDPAFLADVEQRHYTIKPLTGAEVRDAVERLLATPPDIVAKAKKAMGM